MPPAATRRAIDAYALTVRSRAPSAARRIFEPSQFAISDRESRGTAQQPFADRFSVLVPSLSEESQRSLLSLDFPVPDHEPFSAYAMDATRTYSGNVSAVASRLGGLPPTTATQFDLRI
ncbi:MAG: hypothetical protein ACFB22_00640 [Rhodothalassiaceae bacterium]